MRFTVLELALAAMTGGGIGFISGVFGIGGGFLLVPMLNIFLKVPMEFAVGAGACQVLGPATTSLLARRIGFDNLRLPLTIAGGLFVGVFAGAQVFESAKQYGTITLLSRQLPLAEFLVLLVYVVLLISVGLFAIWEGHRFQQNRPIKRGWLTGLKIPLQTQLPEFGAIPVSIITLSWFGLAVGFLSGLLGMSGGLILLPGLIYLLGLKTHQSVISSLITVWIVAFQSTIIHSWHGNIDLSLVMSLLFGGTIGARLGSDIGIKLGGQELRQRFGWLLLFVAAIIIIRLGDLLFP